MGSIGTQEWLAQRKEEIVQRKAEIEREMVALDTDLRGVEAAIDAYRKSMRAEADRRLTEAIFAKPPMPPPLPASSAVDSPEPSKQTRVLALFSPGRTMQVAELFSMAVKAGIVTDASEESRAQFLSVLSTLTTRKQALVRVAQGSYRLADLADAAAGKDSPA